MKTVFQFPKEIRIHHIKNDNSCNNYDCRKKNCVSADIRRFYSLRNFIKPIISRKKLLFRNVSVNIEIYFRGFHKRFFVYIKKHSGNGSAFENKFAVFINFNIGIMAFGIIGNDFVSPFGFVYREGNISFRTVFRHCHFIAVS